MYIVTGQEGVPCTGNKLRKTPEGQCRTGRKMAVDSGWLEHRV